MLKQELINKITEYNRIKEQLERRKIEEPEGKLRVSVDNGKIRYYRCLEGKDKNGEFIQKKNIELAKALAQKSYDEKTYMFVCKRIRQMENLVKTYSDEEIDELFDKQHFARKRLISPVEPICKNYWKNG